MKNIIFWTSKNSFIRNKRNLQEFDNIKFHKNLLFCLKKLIYVVLILLELNQFKQLLWKDWKHFGQLWLFPSWENLFARSILVRILIPSFLIHLDWNRFFRCDPFRFDISSSPFTLQNFLPPMEARQSTLFPITTLHFQSGCTLDHQPRKLACHFVFLKASNQDIFRSIVSVSHQIFFSLLCMPLHMVFLFKLAFISIFHPSFLQIICLKASVLYYL